MLESWGDRLIDEYSGYGICTEYCSIYATVSADPGRHLLSWWSIGYGHMVARRDVVSSNPAVYLAVWTFWALTGAFSEDQGLPRSSAVSVFLYGVRRALENRKVLDTKIYGMIVYSGLQVLRYGTGTTSCTVPVRLYGNSSI